MKELIGGGHDQCFLEDKKKQRGGQWLVCRFNDAGEVLCPYCSRAMVPLELSELMGANLAPHFACPESGLVFFGDSEGLEVCRNVEEDVAEKYTRIKKGEYV